MQHSACKSSRIQTLAIPSSTDITELFAHYCQTKWSILLDSAKSTHKNARFDILVSDPIAAITAYQNVCEIEYFYDPLDEYIPTEKTVKRDGQPISILRSLLQSCLPKEPPAPMETETPLPFTSGAIGYFGYDLGRCYETLPSLAKNSHHNPDMAVGIYSWSVIKDNHTGLFYLTNIPGLPSPSKQEIENVFMTPAPDETQLPWELKTNWQSNMSKADYIIKLQRILDYLHAGDCYQVNLAQRFNAQFNGSTWQGYLRLRQANRAPFSAYIQLVNSTVLSISPERFLKAKNRFVESQPIKGTRPRSTNLQTDQQNIEALKHSEKDRAENLMIVDLLRNDMSKSCEDHSIQVPALFAIESFEAVHHLVSTVTGTLNSHDDSLSLLQGAFPGGSITGAPKIRAMEIIDELEPDRRNIYCGSIGYINRNGDMDTSICIRTLLCEDSQIYCWAGGGIVLDSNPQEEYQESLDKVSKILPILENDYE
ncbi:aminodeoxychorismate synthase component I [Aliiglaciecola sp. 3_MG-2023]|uniref:aminodeoxychorismate synthase component I n=1 Tax=Aliiglaciecola sp. 3_MG-2023 TaxID=3062644 RepID=UPI0026E30332|nr:aminodeoxychorismate synthase component I [Aliiglaciecola sp. 3_MG-2023]MDO6693448.1 aminodeoxychorismate synthase component I [Aliiglaciecola sp. 3_MG-2023]